MEQEYKGYNGTIIVRDQTLVIKRGTKGFLLGGGFLRGDKTIPYSSIVAVQLKKAGLVAGYIQFTLMGGSEAKSGLFQSAMDENSVNFQTWGGANLKFEELRKIVEEKMRESKNPMKSNSLDDIEKLAALREKGIVTEEEFQQKKKQLMGL